MFIVYMVWCYGFNCRYVVILLYKDFFMGKIWYYVVGEIKYMIMF